MRRLLTLAAKVAISGTLLYVAFARVDLSAVVGRLQQAKVSWLILLLLVLSAQLVLVALRWRNIVLQHFSPFPSGMAARYVFIAAFFNQTLPSTIGGDAARIWFLSRAGAGWKTASYSVIVDRVIGLAALVTLVVVSWPWLLGLVRDPIGRASLLLINGAAAVATISFLMVGRLRWDWLERWWITRHLAGAATAALELLSNRRSLGVVAGLSITIHLLTIVAVWCAAHAVAVPLGFGQALLLVLPVVLVATIPISIAGWGVREGAMMAVFTYAGLLDADGLIVSVMYGAGLFATGAIGGAIWILGSERKIWASEENRA